MKRRKEIRGEKRSRPSIQCGALPYRDTQTGMQILLVTSRGHPTVDHTQGLAPRGRPRTAPLLRKGLKKKISKKTVGTWKPPDVPRLRAEKLHTTARLCEKHGTMPIVFSWRPVSRTLDVGGTSGWLVLNGVPSINGHGRTPLVAASGGVIVSGGYVAHTLATNRMRRLQGSTRRKRGIQLSKNV